MRVKARPGQKTKRRTPRLDIVNKGYKPKYPISLCLIAKNEARRIPEFMKSVLYALGHPRDEIVLVDTGSTDGTPRVARDLGWRVYEHPELCDLDLEELGAKWLPPEVFEKWRDHYHIRDGVLRSFAEARQLSFDYARNEHCMWLDLDDILLEPQQLRYFVDKFFDANPHGAFFLDYEYAYDKEDGQCTTLLARERIVTRSDFEWKGRCHESLLPREGAPHIEWCKVKNFPCRVSHKYHKKHQFSDVRNYIIMRHELETHDWRDPRTVYYLANAATGMGQTAEALKLYEEFIPNSGNPDDIRQALITMARIYRDAGRPISALRRVNEALIIDPADPHLHYLMASIYCWMENWKKCLAWIRSGDRLEPTEKIAISEPIMGEFQPAVMGAVAARELGLRDEALEFAYRAYRARPGLKVSRESLELWARWGREEEYGQALRTVLAGVKGEDRAEILKLVPVPLQFNDRGLAQMEVEVPGDGCKPTLAFFCGFGGESWGPDSAKTGIGASEKMVVELAKRLVDRFDVAVYCSLNCEPGVYDGVHYRQGASYNAKLFRDHLVIWRMPQLLNAVPFRAGRIYVWMHDVGTDNVWSPKVLARTDKVMFLTKYHRSRHPSVPEEKVFYTRNGIDLEKHLYDGREKQKKVVFCSSPERGFQTAIRMFRDSGLANDGWTLHLYYGFEGKTFRSAANNPGYGYIPDLDRDSSLWHYADECMGMCDGKEVIYEGRKTWDEMAEVLKDASIWLYPTRFDEISCVAAMEAMAAGCRIVSTDHAALKETLAGYPVWHNLSKISEDGWRDELRLAPACCGKPDGEFARKFDISALADTWANELFVTAKRAEVDTALPADDLLDI